MPFDVTVLGGSQRVEEGKAASIECKIENTSGSQLTETVELRTADTTRDSRDVTLGSGEVTRFDLVWNTLTTDQGRYTARVRSNDDSDTIPLVIEEPIIRTRTSVGNSNYPVEERIEESER